MSSPSSSSVREIRRPPARWHEPAAPGLMDLNLPFVRVSSNDPRIAAMREALYEVDPLADRLALWVQESPAHRALFARAVEHGIATIPSPPEPLAAFFAHVDDVPPWLDRDTVRLGTETMPGVFAQIGMEYGHRYGGTSFELFAKIAEKNHAHSTLNPFAAYQKRFTLDEIMNDVMIAYPNTRPM